MGIKKIDFVNEQGDRDDYFCTELPTGQYATVEMVSEDIGFGEQWNWEISVGEYTKKCGTEESKDLAIKACQAAWEKMVKEALEPIALYVISTEEGIDSICTSADGAKLRQQEVMACSGCMEGFVIVEEFVVDLDGNVTEVEYEEE